MAVRSIAIVETSGEGAHSIVNALYEATGFEDTVDLYLHFGVHGGATQFHVEQVGVNGAINGHIADLLMHQKPRFAFLTSVDGLLRHSPFSKNVGESIIACAPGFRLISL